jgi:HEAT repeat protein
LAALRGLSLSRATPGFREVVDEILQETDPQEAFHHHFSRLLQGSTRPADANDGARQLANLLSSESLDALKSAVGHPDPLIFRHALHLVGLIPSKEAAEYLHDYLKDAQQEALEDRKSRALLAEFRSLSRPEVQEQTIKTLLSRWEKEQPELCTNLTSDRPDLVQGAVTALRALTPGVTDTFLLDTLLAALDSKQDRLAAHLLQAGEAAQQRARRIDFGLDSSAQSLATMASQGLIDGESLLPALTEPLRQNTGGVGLVRALAQVVPASAQDLLDLLLGQSDSTLRSAALEILGERKDPALKPSLLKLSRDTISDLADRSLWHLGQLADPGITARTFLANPDPEELMVGLRFVAIHRMEDLVPDVLEIITSQSRENVLLKALDTLKAIGSHLAVEPVLALLHSGQSPRLQTALAETLRDLGDADGAIGLCSRADELNSASLHAIAVEALAKAHATPESPLPRTQSNLLLKAIQSGWKERNPWPLRRRIADAVLAIQVEDPVVLTALFDLIQETLNEKRPPGSVSTEDLAHLQSCARALTKLLAASCGG